MASVMVNRKEHWVNRRKFARHGLVRGIRPALILLLACLSLAGIVASIALAQEQKHSNPSKSCVSSKCHVKIVKHKYLHGPLQIGQCTVCHLPLPGPDHKFKIAAKEEKLCMTCHQRVQTKGYIQHDPVAKGKCLGCHDPHGSEQKSQVRKTPDILLCNECHKKKPVLTRKYAHKPVAEGKCLPCHQPHESKYKNLLDTSGSQLCLQQCHEKMRPVIVGGRERKVHLASEDCARCHRAHDSDLPALLTRSPAELCLDGCHKEIKAKMESSEFKHDAMTKGMACVECHRAHDNQFGRLLRKPETELCLGSCHDKFQDQVEAAKFKHRPVADRSCDSCHLPHGATYSGLLFADYPSGTSLAYDPARYALCFSCHTEKITDEHYTTKDTDFRNGRLNLHYLHVNKEKDGVTCRACHVDHAGDQPDLIRDKMQYGNWKISLRFKKTNTGGSCLSGCHGEYSYDRVNPVKLSAQ
jgi:predicted CXXCH cytochrome family protein